MINNFANNYINLNQSNLNINAILAESGEELSRQDSKNYQYILKSYLEKYNLLEEDLYILDKKGKPIKLSSDKLNTDNKLFLYHKKFIKDQQLKNHIEKNLDIMYTQCNNNYIPSLISKLVILNANDLITSNNIQDIKLLNQNIHDTLDIVKENFRKFKIQIKLGEKLRDNLNNQSKAVSVLYSFILEYSEKIKLGYNYLISQSESADEKVKSCLNNYENGLNFLKSNELHPKMQSDKAKYLIDIYYPEEDMSKWKRKCLEFDHKIKAKINWINNQINLNISKISREKQNTINSFKISISDNHSIFDKYINIKETFFCDLLSQIKEHANSLYKEVQTLINNNNINSNYTSNKVIEELINLYQGSDVNISGNSNLFKDKNKLLVANIVEETKEHVDILKNLVVKNMDTITTIFSNYHIVLVSFNEINSSFNKYENQIKELEKDIDYLNNPSIFPEAYKNSLIEVRRRLMFNKTIMSIIERMHEILNKESENRKYFISKFGKYLTNDYLPSLKRVDIKLTIDFKNNQELTRLPDLLISDDDEEYKKFNCLLSRLDVKIGQNISGNAISSINANSNPRLIIENVDTSNLNNKQVISNSSNVLNVNDLEVNKLDTNIVNSSNNNNINQANYLINNLEVSSSNNSNNHNPQSSIIKELSETGIESLEGYFRIIRIRNKELEQKLNFKDTEYKKIENNLIEKELKLNKVIEETDKLSDTFTSIENNYLKQMSIKDQRIEEKTKEINNLLNKIFEKQSLNSKGEISGDCNIINYNKKCEMCIYNLKNNVNSSNNSNSVQDSWPSYVYSLNNQLLNANNQISSLDNLNRELAADISFIKLTFFNNLNRITSIKNTDIAKLKEINESKITENEECFKIAKLKVEEEAKLKVSFIENNLNEIKKELNKFKKELEVKNHINNKLQQEVTENKEKIKTNNEYYNNIISNLKIELDKKNKEISNLKEEKYSEINKIKTEFNNQLNEKQDEIIKLNRLFNKTTADLKSEVLEYSALCEKQDNLLKEKILDLEKKEYELNNLEEVFKKFKNQKESELQSLQLLFNNLEKENKDYKMQLEESRNKLNNSFDKTISKDTNNKNNNEINLDYNFNYNNDLLATKDNINSTTNNYSNNDLYLNTVKISNNNTNDNSNSNNKINNYNVYNCTRKNFNEESEITKVSQENFYYDYSTTKIASLENNGLTQYNTTKLFSDVEELVNIKKLEKGIRCLFVPFSEGLYVPIMLNKIDYNSEEGKVYKCQYILSISNFDSNLKELIFCNSLIIIGRINKISEYSKDMYYESFRYTTNYGSDNEEFNALDNLNSLDIISIIEIDKPEFVIGFSNDELQYKDYLCNEIN